MAGLLREIIDHEVEDVLAELAKVRSDIVKFIEKLVAEPLPPLDEAYEVTFTLYSKRSIPQDVPKERSTEEVVDQHGSMLALSSFVHDRIAEEP